MRTNPGLKISFAALAFAMLLTVNASAQTFATPTLGVRDANNKFIGSASAVIMAIIPGAAIQTQISTVLIQYRPVPLTGLSFVMPFDMLNQQYLQGQVFYDGAGCTGKAYAVSDSLRAAQMVNQVAYVPAPLAAPAAVAVLSTRTSAGCGFIAPPVGATFVPIAQVSDFTANPVPYYFETY